MIFGSVSLADTPYADDEATTGPAPVSEPDQSPTIVGTVVTT